MWNNVLTHIVKYLTSFDVKWNSPLYICEANISQRSYFTWRNHISLAEGEFRWKKKSKSFRLAFFFLAPRTGLEPVTSPTVSDSQARANIVGATRQSHSRLRRSLAHFRYSLLYAFDFKKQPFRLFFLVNYQLRPRPSAFSVGIQMEINHDVTDLHDLEKTKSHWKSRTLRF